MCMPLLYVTQQRFLAHLGLEPLNGVVVEWGGILKNLLLYARLEPYTKVQV